MFDVLNRNELERPTIGDPTWGNARTSRLKECVDGNLDQVNFR